MQVDKDKLCPKIRNMEKSIIIAASGTSCRHQVFNNTNRIEESIKQINDHNLT